MNLKPEWEKVLTTFPALPQVDLLRQSVKAIWKREEVAAVWLGGSLAAGTADQYSDIDLRIAVTLDTLEAWKTVDASQLFGRTCVGEKIQPFGPTAFLRHLLLDNGDLIDLFVQTTQTENPEHAILILACRDDAFADKLMGFKRPAETAYPAARSEVIRQIIVEFWMNSHKHRKVLHRGLDSLVLVGLQFDRANLTRLWHASLTGTDVGVGRPTIHGMSRVLRTVQDAMGKRAMDVLGAGCSDGPSLCRAIEELQNEVAKVGRTLAASLQFPYPDALEQTVRAGWNKFLESGAKYAGQNAPLPALRPGDNRPGS